MRLLKKAASNKKKNTNGKELDQYPKHVVLFLSSTDSYVGYDKMYYSLNGSSEKLFSGQIKNFILEKDYLLKVKALDKLGNQTKKEIEFSIGY